jgi:alkaline phosphatase D
MPTARERPGSALGDRTSETMATISQAHVRQGTTAIDRYTPPSVRNRPVQRFDENGLGIEANNLAAIRSLTAYRTPRCGRHLELFITDQRPVMEQVIVDGDPGLGL